MADKRTRFLNKRNISITGIFIVVLLIILNVINYLDEMHSFTATIFVSETLIGILSIMIVIVMYQHFKNRLDLFKRFFDDGPIPKLLIDPESGRIKNANKAAAIFYGWSREKLKKMNIYDINILPAREIRMRINSSLTLEQSSFSFQHRNFQGEIRDVQVFSGPIIINGKTLLFSIIQDMSQQKRIENDLIIAKEKAETSDRLKMAFLKNISHEIRTPMNGILGFTNLLKEKNLSETDKDRYIHTINKSANQLLDIIDQVLEVSRIECGIESLQLSAFNLNHVMDEIYHTYKPKITVGFFQHQDLTGNKSIIESDKTKIIQIFSCLINNAIKYTSSGEITFGYRIKNSDILFFVKDSGIGIPEQEHFNIFEKFYSIDNDLSKKFGGNGLGLSIAKSLTEMLQGRIWVNSIPGKGSEFYFSVPYKASEITSEQDTLQDFNFSGLSILIVEDEPTVYNFLRIILSLKGAGIQWAKNGNEAIQMVQLNKPDMILMDLKMPVMNGIEATRKIKAIHPDIPVIAQSAYSLPEERNLAFAAGCNEFITKPIKAESLFIIIKQIQAEILPAMTE